LGEQPDVFVIDGFNFLHAELANLLAAKIFTSTLAATRTTRTRRTTLSAVGTARRTISARGTVSY
jgi:uridine kinase